MKLAIVILLLASFAEAGVTKFTAKHILKPVWIHGIWRPLKIGKKVVW